MLIRDTRASDIETVQRIYADHVRNGLASFEEEPPSIDELARRRDDILGRGLPYLVAEENGRVLGYAYAGPYRSRTAYRYTVEDSIYIEGTLVGRGIGRALLDELIARCEKGQWRQMVAVIGDSGNRPSIALHERLGFRLTGTLHAVGFKFGRWVDVVIMQRQLGDGSRSDPA